MIPPYIERVPYADRVRLLRALIIEPTTTLATNVELARRSRRELGRLDFEDVRLLLKAESDGIVERSWETIRRMRGEDGA